MLQDGSTFNNLTILNVMDFLITRQVYAIMKGQYERLYHHQHPLWDTVLHFSKTLLPLKEMEKRTLDL